LAPTAPLAVVVVHPLNIPKDKPSNIAAKIRIINILSSAIGLAAVTPAALEENPEAGFYLKYPRLRIAAITLY
jgi:hypothetical protein